MNGRMVMAVVVAGTFAGGCASEDEATAGSAGMFVEQISDGERVLEVRALGRDGDERLPAYQLIYTDAEATRSAVVTSPVDDSVDNAAAVALFARMPEEFRATVLAAAAAGSLGDLFDRFAWLACVKWCLFIDGDPAMVCATECCEDPDLIEICLPVP